MWIDKEALTEVEAIIEMMPNEESIKIPQELKKFLKIKKSTKYIPNIRKDIPLYQQNLKEDTKTLCSLIYRNYLCTPEEKIKLESRDAEILLQNKKEYRETYGFDELLRKRKMDELMKKEVIENEEKNQLVQYREEKGIKKIFCKILSWLKKG